jgi:hypothetical protein
VALLVLWVGGVVCMRDMFVLNEIGAQEKKLLGSLLG